MTSVTTAKAAQNGFLFHISSTFRILIGLLVALPVCSFRYHVSVFANVFQPVRISDKWKTLHNEEHRELYILDGVTFIVTSGRLVYGLNKSLRRGNRNCTECL